MIEAWRDIPGYEGYYQASTFGNIKSLERVITQKHDNTLYSRVQKSKILRPGTDKKEGHLKVVLAINNIRKTYRVHILVMLTFKGKRPEGELIRHLNGKPDDNSLDNLSYGSKYENVLDVFRIGKAWKILYLNEVFEIKNLLNNGMRNIDIAWLYGVSKAEISDIKRKRRFGWAEEGVDI